mmetsp:Transcript_49964/g.128585  ORF Transcript_49964/g.128585 Transcript_49964/m.128585 type:complete len:235 (-) Transcript_49964:645-1349(-)
MKRSRSEADDGGLPGPAGRGLEPTQRLTQSVGVARPAAVRHPVPGGGADSRIFQKGAWLQLLSSLDLPTFPPADKSKLDKILALPELKHTCKSIAKNPDTLKVPLFVCAVSWLTSINGGAYVKLQDPTGMVTASIHPEVFGEEFGKDISIGCAMVLRRVGFGLRVIESLSNIGVCISLLWTQPTLQSVTFSNYYVCFLSHTGHVGSPAHHTEHEEFFFFFSCSFLPILSLGFII